MNTLKISGQVWNSFRIHFNISKRPSNITKLVSSPSTYMTNFEMASSYVVTPRSARDQLPEQRSASARTAALTRTHTRASLPSDAASSRGRYGGWRGAKLANFANFCKFLAGSFSAVSKRNFARKYAFDSIFQALQDLHPFAPLQSQNFRKKSV